MNKEVTVVIPNYNGIKYIDNCLKSIYEGTVVPQVIVVDNASKDGSAELISQKYPQCRLISLAENTGFCHAVNEGIRLADSEYVILLNNDTTADRQFTEKLLHSIKEKKGAFSVGAKMLSMSRPDIIDDAGDLYCALGWAFALGKGKSKEAYQKGTQIFAACAGAAIYQKSILEEIGSFDENHFAYLEDIDIGYRAKLFGYRNYYEPEALVYHAGSAVSGSRYNEFKVRLAARNSVYLIAKNMPFLQIILNAIFLLPGFCIKALFFAKKGMGGVYLRGLREGVKLSVSESGRKKRVHFQWKRLGNYVRIQVELWVNVVRRVQA